MDIPVQSFDTFIFDLDGTLLDTVADLVETTNIALVEFGMPTRTRAEIISFTGDGVRSLLESSCPKGTPQTVVDEIFNRWDILFEQQGLNATKAYPCVLETLTHLRKSNAKLAIVSNKREVDTQLTINTLLPGLFDQVHGSSAEYPRKPNPEGLLKTMDELQACAETTLYVGDTAGDIHTAQAAGVHSAAVTYGYGDLRALLASGPDFVLDSFDQLRGLARPR